MEILTTTAMQSQARALKARGVRIGFVPTMGALHEGHLSLMGYARAEADVVVASIFVNPAQFGPAEDFVRYPRDPDGDAQKCKGAGVDLLWLPTVEEIYPAGYQTSIETPELAAIHEGAIRPGHFRGVATVVYQLSAIVQPEFMVLGQKDAQQCVVLETMVRDLRLPFRVVRRPTVRDGDGVALSSRNAYLGPREREAARAIPQALRAAREAARQGRRAEEVRAIAGDRLAREPGLRADYVIVVDGDEFTPIEGSLRPRALLAVAVRIGATRLIDNAWLLPPDAALEGADRR